MVLIKKVLKIGKRNSMKNSKELKMNKQTAFTFKLLNLLKKCKEKSKYNLYGKLIKKYNIDEKN